MEGNVHEGYQRPICPSTRGSVKNQLSKLKCLEWTYYVARPHEDPSTFSFHQRLAYMAQRHSPRPDIIS